MAASCFAWQSAAVEYVHAVADTVAGRAFAAAVAAGSVSVAAADAAESA